MFYLLVTVVCFIGCMTTFCQGHLKEAIAYMFLTIAVGTLTIMLEPNRDPIHQDKVEMMGLSVLGSLVLVLMFLIYVTAP